MTGVINLADYNRAVCEWLHANGANPDDIPIDSDLYITGDGPARVLHYETYVCGTDGCRLADARGEKVVEQRTVPLTVEPPAHWQPVQKPTREALLAVVDAVRKLHQPAPDHIGGLSLNTGQRCAACDQPYRCSTIRTLDAMERP